MNKIRGACIALGAVLAVGGFIRYYDRDFDDAQVATDRETVDCLTHQLTREEKASIARLSAGHDDANVRRMYTDVLSRCVLRADQWDRRAQLVTSARQSLSYDSEFRQMLDASTMTPARRP